MEEFALAKETDDGLGRAARRSCAPTSPTARRSCAALEARWEREKASLEGEGELRRQLDQLRIEADRLLREGNLDGGQRDPLRPIPELEKQIARGRGGREVRRLEPLVGEEVGAEQIAEVVEAWTGIPTGRMLRARPPSCCEMEDGHRRAADRPAATRCTRSATPYAARGPASPTRTGPPARSCSSARPAPARPSWPSRWRTSSSTTSGRSCAST